MTEYHKIQTVFLRDPETKYKTLLEGQYALPEFQYLANNDWVWTEKVDGTNIRVMWDMEKMTFGGKTERAQIPAHLSNALVGMFPKKKFADFDAPVCLYGEGYGPKIQKGGGNYREDQSFVLFDVRVGEWWLKREDVVEIATRLEIGFVPIVGIGPLPAMVEYVRSTPLSTWGPFVAEGVVARPAVDLLARSRQRIITKLKVKDFGAK